MDKLKFQPPYSRKYTRDDSDCFDSTGNHKSSRRKKSYPNERSLNTSKSVTFYEKVAFPNPIQCEIIGNELQKAYTEYVAFCLKKKMGILCNILFLEDKALLNRRIYDVAHQGGLYVVVINPQNEKHKSVTVHILQGTPQEHRNMPLEDALNLLAHNFHDHIRSQREYMERERTARGQYIGIVADREVQFLLRMLADGRNVSLSEMNKVIKYLTQRRDNMQTSYDVLFGKDSAFHIDPVIQIIKSEKPEIKKALEALMHNRPTF